MQTTSKNSSGIRAISVKKDLYFCEIMSLLLKLTTLDLIVSVPDHCFSFYFALWKVAVPKIAVCFLWLSLPGDYRVTDEALLAETT